MNSRQRLMATLRGEPVDRPAVSFYEIGGFAADPCNPDPFNIYNDPSWRPLLELAETQSDLIRLRSAATRPRYPEIRDRYWKRDTCMQNGSRFTRTTLRVGGRTMGSLERRDPAIDTIWVVEHLLKDTDDLKAFLQLPDEVFAEVVDVSSLITEDAQLGDRGIIMVDTPDPLCLAAAMFSMEDFTVIAFAEQELFVALLEKLARHVHERAAIAAREFPGRLWRIYGPEYASEPYLPPELFQRYVVPYVRPMVDSIHKYGGFARVHCHGRVRKVLPHLVAMGVDATDPLEPPPHGDITLAEVRRQYGRHLVLFGNLEATDIENLAPEAFEMKVREAIEQGTGGSGRGFVLLPSAAPYGREIRPNVLANYHTMVRLIRET